MQAHISKNKTGLREERQYCKENQLSVLLRGDLTSQSLGATGWDSAFRLQTHNQRLYPRGQSRGKGIPASGPARVSTSWARAAPVQRGVWARAPGVAGAPSGGETLQVLRGRWDQQMQGTYSKMTET